MLNAASVSFVRSVVAVMAVTIIVAALASSTVAQGVLTPRTAELPDEDVYPYVPVNLNRLPKDTQGVQLPADRLMAWKSIPFDLAKKKAANCLFLKPLGWSAAKNED